MSEQSFGVAEVLAHLRQGKVVLVTDDHDREHEVDLLVAAEFATSEAINFMVTFGRGLVCVALPQQRLAQLGLEPMVPPGVATERHGTAFTISVDAREGTTTGISAQDRARTVHCLVEKSARPEDLLRPGHVFPLAADPRGVLRRRGHTEAAVDLTRLAGLTPGGVICEVLDEAGQSLRGRGIDRFADQHKLAVVSIADLVEYRWQHDTVVERGATAQLPTEFGEFQVTDFRLTTDGSDHVALIYGDVPTVGPTLVRVHSECLTGDALHSLRCDCGEQLHQSLQAIAAAGAGVLLYLRQEGRGIGLAAKLQAYALQDSGLDTFEANLALGFPPDARHYGVAAQILRSLGVERVRLLTNNPDKVDALRRLGIAVVERVPVIASPRPERARYLATKRERMSHLLPTGHTFPGPNSHVSQEERELLDASCA
ncbi:MAG: GTP cyclohydrolase II [Chloroflexi bacterium]|nr:GTP cyclohydrolase II [Chloroflexota bacterium]